MTTDTALGVTKLVVHDRIPLNEIPFIVSLCYFGMVYLLRPKLRRIIPLSNSIQRNQWKCHSASKSLFVIIFGTHLNIGTGYIADGKEPRLPPGMKKHLYEDMNKPFDL